MNANLLTPPLVQRGFVQTAHDHYSMPMGGMRCDLIAMDDDCTCIEIVGGEVYHEEYHSGVGLEHRVMNITKRWAS